jgi:hypothetical protein
VSEYAHATEKKLLIVAAAVLLVAASFLEASLARFAYISYGTSAVPHTVARIFGVRQYAHCRSVYHPKDH